METKATEGTIEAIKQPTVLRTGTGKKGKWTLWSVGIKLKDEWHNATSFNKKELEDILSGHAQGDCITITDEKNTKGYWQISSITKSTHEDLETGTAKEHAEPTEEEIKACQDDPIERFGKVYAQCKAKIEEIYGVKINFAPSNYPYQELIAAVNTMFIQAAREIKW